MTKISRAAIQAKADLADAIEALESLASNWAKMALEDKIDAMARLHGPAKTIAKLDADLKKTVKDEAAGKAAVYLGRLFKAIVAVRPFTRLDQSKVKEEFPKVYEACVKHGFELLTTYEPR